MRPQVSESLREEVRRLVGNADDYWGHGYTGAAGREEAPALDRSLAYSVLPDVLHFHYQTTHLLGAFKHIAYFRDDGPDGDPLPLLVFVPDLQRPGESYARLLAELDASQVPLEAVRYSQHARQVFEDRLAEFLTLQLATGARPAQTVVHSNRQGDTVICAKGYFASTGTAFGVSTPAQGNLRRGRYSFGIIDSGRHRFEGIVWTCPTTVRLNLP